MNRGVPAALLLLLAAALPARAGDGGPTLAVEDTLDAPITAVVPEVLVRAERVPLDEILRRVAEGEARRDSLMQDQSFDLLFKVLYLDEAAAGGRSRVASEKAARVYLKRPDRRKVVPLRDRELNEDRKENVRVEVSSSLSEEMVSFAFRPEARASFRFRILDRAFVGGHLIYHIAFEPRSRHDALPSGEVWVDTNDFVILREEFRYERSPAPVFLKSIDRCVIERTRVDGRWWVVERILARVTLNGLSSRLLVRAGDGAPVRAVVLSAWQTGWRVNAGLADSLFAEEGS